MGKERTACMTCQRVKVAIDGPAGAGKSTVARAVADKVGYTYLDTGAMYRALAVTALERGISLNDPLALGQMARDVAVTVSKEPGLFRVWVDGVEVTDQLRVSGTEDAVKVLAMHRPVREVLVGLQRDLSKGGGVVVEGRDIGTVVLPDAQVKVFLTAKRRERALRRWRQFHKGSGGPPWEEVYSRLLERDAKDQERDWGRLVVAPDAVFLDTSGKTLDEAVGEISGLVREAASFCSTTS